MLAKNLHERTSIFEYGSLIHNLYGIWTDKDENIYVAVLGGQVVKKITANGKVSNVVYSSGLWSPDSGLFDDDGNLWLMESNILNEVRVRKIEQKELTKSVSQFLHLIRKLIPFIIVAALIISFTLLLFKLYRINFR